ncbi:MAG: patatin-like phospholipase family protein [Gaiellaceae bacterium]
MTGDAPPRRGLILAGGGLKVAFEAGVLQVWLDELEDERLRRFDLADGASGGVFNLAMWCQGMSGTEIADAWRRTNPLSFFAMNPRPWRAFSSLDRFAKNVLHGTWGIDEDWHRVRELNRDATFNVYNFTEHQLVQRRPHEMNDQWLLACVTLPFWFPPQRIDGKLYIDSVYSTDANLVAAMEGGADELWVVWTMNTDGAWGAGPVNQYFATIEAAANGRLNELKNRIEASNQMIATERAGEFRRPIELKILQAEVPMNYLFSFNRDTLREAVELGVQHARKWCDDNDIKLRPAPAREPERTRLVFRETMKGPLTFDGNSSAELTARLEIDVEDVDRFLTSPQHEASIRGMIESDAFGGNVPVEEGRFNLFTYGANPWERTMRYRLGFRDPAGHPLVLEGEKYVPGGPRFRPWRDTTTMYTRIHQRDGAARPFAEGEVRLTPLSFLRQVTSIRARGRGPVGDLGLLLRFLVFFVGVCLRVYLGGRPLPAKPRAPRSEDSQT